MINLRKSAEFGENRRILLKKHPTIKFMVLDRPRVNRKLQKISRIVLFGIILSILTLITIFIAKSKKRVHIQSTESTQKISTTKRG